VGKLTSYMNVAPAKKDGRRRAERLAERRTVEKNRGSAGANIVTHWALIPGGN
jgi:hypothetical protein